MSDARLWLAGLVALPALVIGASLLRIDVERLRRLAVASAIVMLLAALAIPLSPSLRAFSIRSSALSWIPGGEEIVRIDTLSAALLPFAAGLWLLTVAVTPANVYMLQRPDLFAISQWLLIARLALQVALLALIWWSTAPRTMLATRG